MKLNNNGVQNNPIPEHNFIDHCHLPLGIIHKNNSRDRNQHENQDDAMQ